MNYELAKKLKDAGFPQGGSLGHFGKDHAAPRRSEEIVWYPTLEELIEFSDGDGKIKALYAEYTEKTLQKLRRSKES